MNGIYYINANLPAAQTSFVGRRQPPALDEQPDQRQRRRTPSVLKNQNDGPLVARLGARSRSSFRQGFLKAAYSYGESKNTVDPGSIAFGSWTGNHDLRRSRTTRRSRTPNQFPGHRVFLAGSYRLEYLKFGATTFSFFWQGYTNGVASYTYSGDLNGDRGTGNDLLYIPRDSRR